MSTVFNQSVLYIIKYYVKVLVQHTDYCQRILELRTGKTYNIATSIHYI